MSPWFAKNQRMYMTPSVAGRVFTRLVDVRDALKLVRIPTLVLHREGFEAVPVENGRYLAEHIAGAGFEFEDRGEHELKGVPGTWKLFAVKS